MRRCTALNVNDETDQLLANFAKELDYFVFARDHLRPVMEQLLAAVERVIANAADGVARGEASHLRAAYFEKFVAVQPLLEEWLLIRGSAELLREAEDALSPRQQQHFEALLAREASISSGRENFDSLQDHLRRRLLRFEELSG